MEKVLNLKEYLILRNKPEQNVYPMYFDINKGICAA
jgi:hypothetical protein